MLRMKEKQGTVPVMLSRTVYAWFDMGGIKFKVWLFMSATVLLVAFSLSVFFFLEGRSTLRAQILDRLVATARQIGSFVGGDIYAKDKTDAFNKMKSQFAKSQELYTASTLLYFIIYDQQYNVFVGGTTTAMLFKGDYIEYSLPHGKDILRAGVIFKHKFSFSNDSVSVDEMDGVYDITLPIISGSKLAGYMRLGFFAQPPSQELSGVMKNAVIVLISILLVGIALSNMFANGITKPIQQLNDAIDKLSKQNWDTPISVKGASEISKLGQSFNKMASALKNREMMLARGNHDLFILHTAGLDFMEILDRDALLPKIALRAEDLIRADTIAISMTTNSRELLRYLGVFGTKEKVIKECKLPIESGGIYNWFASYGEPLLIEDAANDFRLDSETMRTLGVKSIISVPLWSSNMLSGIFTAINKQGSMSFDKHDLRLCTVLSNLAAAALQNVSLYGALRDKVVELKAAQEQLVHSAKMAAIGELSTNVAHEINNPLTSALGYTTHLLKTVQLPDDSRRILKIMEQEILRVRKFIRNLLDFARHKPSRMKPSDISLPLQEAVALVQGIATATGVTIHVTYALSPVTVNIDHNEMKQVFVNIAGNALQAMQHGGELRVRLELANEAMVVVEFSDTGVGISPENIDKIFEPFFTTRHSSDGTGLGLSISNRIVRNHGGSIEVVSEVGKGSRFKVFLPLCQKLTKERNS